MYSQEIADEICRRLANGETLRQICKTEGMPSHPTVCLWALGLHGAPVEFGNQYARARSSGLDVIAEQIIDIADDPTGDYVETEDGQRVDQEHIQRSRLRVDARKWLLSKMRPDKYGDRTILAGDKENKLEVVVRSVLDDPPKP